MEASGVHVVQGDVTDARGSVRILVVVFWTTRGLLESVHREATESKGQNRRTLSFKLCSQGVQKRSCNFQSVFQCSALNFL